MLSADREILVGRSAVTGKVEASTHSQRSMNEMAMPPPVRSGDPIILRNCYNGGILSVDQRGRMVLIIDSYNHDQQHGIRSLLGRLQNHDRTR